MDKEEYTRKGESEEKRKGDRECGQKDGRERESGRQKAGVQGK